ncbi:EPIDERMAL PATTERNING FACTOR-like protein 2 isoform X1 [Amborella trichopoda]|uniref:EPIDERMAL PATTERNING FACTOR-like protein 2 isoform X1 n=1 Tax=Amborella trichopoda TaxID=13333 RepID=UPI0009BDE027|nr:EPIDERMAL PATTERNING FACTOR-like protein 2 isoform X1 [Amborella trichopoda]|eukprot:XP_020525703.1 EPIDERMAL PATTERNING FACTOR-like protein 2 isoform X1 [Amborella trichopoda]
MIYRSDSSPALLQQREQLLSCGGMCVQNEELENHHGSRTNSKLDISHAKMGGVERGNMRQVPGGLKAQIGSRPPRCEKKCILCGHCEPILVPAFPQYKSGRRHAALVSFSSRFEDSSNYKPMNWKCKCGNMIFNP